jgi:hypothetical protein
MTTTSRSDEIDNASSRLRGIGCIFRRLQDASSKNIRMHLQDTQDTQDTPAGAEEWIGVGHGGGTGFSGCVRPRSVQRRPRARFQPDGIFRRLQNNDSGTRGGVVDDAAILASNPPGADEINYLQESESETRGGIIDDDDDPPVYSRTRSSRKRKRSKVYIEEDE